MKLIDEQIGVCPSNLGFVINKLYTCNPVPTWVQLNLVVLIRINKFVFVAMSLHT